VARPHRDWGPARIRYRGSQPARIIPIAARASAPPPDRAGYNAVVHAMARIVREALDAERESDSDKLA